LAEKTLEVNVCDSDHHRIDDGSAGTSVYTTHANTTSHSEVAVFTKRISPAVLDCPILLALVLTKTNQEESMVQCIFMALFGRGHTFLVRL